MKVAFVQDWFNANGGAEKVAGAILDIYDKEDLTIYALFDKFPVEARAEILSNRPVQTSILQYIPYISRIYRYFLPVMPWLMSRFRLRGYDMVISTSHAVAKGFKADKGTLNICYCHTPLRPIWDMYDDYAASHPMGGFFPYRAFVNYLRRWDVATAGRVHYFIANSKHIQQRIEKSYGRQSAVIYPPVRVEQFTLSTKPRKDYYLCVGRIVPYKKIDLIVKAFMQMPEKNLVVIGDGWGATAVNEMIKDHKNIEWHGYQDDKTMLQYIQEARACIFAAKEDFGIMCVEVQACGTPVIALNYGGYKETVIAGETGLFFDQQTELSIIDAVTLFDNNPLINHTTIRDNALRFSEERFGREFKDFVQQANQEFHNGRS